MNNISDIDFSYHAVPEIPQLNEIFGDHITLSFDLPYANSLADLTGKGLTKVEPYPPDGGDWIRLYGKQWSPITPVTLEYENIKFETNLESGRIRLKLSPDLSQIAGWFINVKGETTYYSEYSGMMEPINLDAYFIHYTGQQAEYANIGLYRYGSMVALPSYFTEDGSIGKWVIGESTSPMPKWVTEPATLLLFGIGLIGLVGFRRKRLKL
jgi:hypothetical protein